MNQFLLHRIWRAGKGFTRKYLSNCGNSAMRPSKINWAANLQLTTTYFWKKREHFVVISLASPSGVLKEGVFRARIFSVLLGVILSKTWNLFIVGNCSIRLVSKTGIICLTKLLINSFCPSSGLESITFLKKKKIKWMMQLIPHQKQMSSTI